MQIRGSLISVLVVAVPIIFVLLAALVLTRQQTVTSIAKGDRPAASNNVAPSMTNGAMSTGEKSMSATQAVAAEPPAPPRPAGPPAPELIGGGSWINSDPLTLAQLRGQVVLVNFWTYGCYNCQNTLPYVKQWWNKYKDQGLVIIGVHTPEFDSEAQLQNVQDAVRREGIGWPVVQDNDKRIWQAYGNHYWPRFYLLNHQGQIIYDHIGEGAYEEMDRQIAAALAAKSK